MKKFVLFIGIFVAGGIALFILQKASTVIGEWRIIQTIQTTNKAHTAELRRLYGYIDVNFQIIVDGRKVYTSPDFAPVYDRPFREWIAWDENQKNLVFIVADQILFAYNLDTHAQISKDKFDSLAIPRYTLRDLQYEGDYDGKKLGGNH